MSSWNDPELIKLFTANTPLIDVRAPVEFKEGFIPRSVNLPILNDQERAQVGTCYKKRGQEAATELGHQLVSGPVKELRVKSWMDYIQDHPTTEVFCFRGGLRSGTACDWIKQAGIIKHPLPGGFKRMRTFFLSWLNEAPLPELIRVGGPTGSAKTDFIQGFTHIDLEKIANHRGSAFGAKGEQPAQITFENQLALEIMLLSGQRIIIEDESATVGKMALPRRLFFHMRDSPMVILKVSREERIQNIFNSYVMENTLPFFLSGLEKIKNALGGVNYQLIQTGLRQAFAHERTLSAHQEWIGQLLDLYYDPLYSKGLDKQTANILFSGTPEEVTHFLDGLAR